MAHVSNVARRVTGLLNALKMVITGVSSQIKLQEIKAQIWQRKREITSTNHLLKEMPWPKKSMAGITNGVINSISGHVGRGYMIQQPTKAGGKGK